MTPYYQDDLVTLWHGDCIAVMRELPEVSVDAVVTDPPYGLSFMGKGWDDGRMLGQMATGRERRGALAYGGSHDRGYADHDSVGFQAFSQLWATEALRVLKPGGHLLAFGGTRTWHRLAVAIEDAGFEVRDSIAWMYGSGFPKSLDVSKAIDRAAGARDAVGKGFVTAGDYNGRNLKGPDRDYVDPPPATPAAQQWQGWGTALKPAFEPIVVARKPLIGTVAENVLAHGTGALNIDGCRIGTDGGTTKGNAPKGASNGIYGNGINGACDVLSINAGRWPANVILDESQAAELDRQSGNIPTQHNRATLDRSGDGGMFGVSGGGIRVVVGAGEEGGASRFFYVPKANSSERPRAGEVAHPTVKPLELMRYLVKLVTPPGGTVLEPFAGSGTTLEACLIEGFNVIGIELTEDYLPLITQRISKPIEQVLL